MGGGPTATPSANTDSNMAIPSANTDSNTHCLLSSPKPVLVLRPCSHSSQKLWRLRSKARAQEQTRDWTASSGYCCRCSTGQEVHLLQAERRFAVKYTHAVRQGTTRMPVPYPHMCALACKFPGFELTAHDTPINPVIEPRSTFNQLSSHPIHPTQPLHMGCTQPKLQHIFPLASRWWRRSVVSALGSIFGHPQLYV